MIWGDGMKDLEECRKEIDQIDKQMVELFEKRFELVKEVIAYKQAHDLPIFDASREEAVINKNLNYLKNEELQSYYQDFLQHLMDLSKQYQQEITKKEGK